MKNEIGKVEKWESEREKWLKLSATVTAECNKCLWLLQVQVMMEEEETIGPVTAAKWVGKGKVSFYGRAWGIRVQTFDPSFKRESSEIPGFDAVKQGRLHLLRNSALFPFCIPTPANCRGMYGP